MRKLHFLLLVLVTILFFSCQQDEYSQSDSQSQIERLQGIQMCTFDFVNSSLDTSEISTRAVLEKRTKWANGSVIRVKFMNGDAFVQSKVKQFANEWIRYANLHFVWVPSDAQADIRVAFNWNGDTGSWSYIGAHSSYMDQNKPSINFGWFDSNTTDTEFSRVIIHEFGHALGLKHEHQHPLNDIAWNKSVVYAYYINLGWDQNMVDQNFFEKLSIEQTNYSSYDPHSIMHYRIDPSFTTNGYGVELNTILSDTDKAFIASEYPKDKEQLPTIQEAWVNTGLMEWTNSTKTALQITELGKQQESFADVSDGEQLISAYGMFKYSLLKKAPMFNTSNIKEFRGMFYECKQLTDIPQYNTSNGVDFSLMFAENPSIKTIPLLDTSKGTNFNSMFRECRSLASIPSLNIAMGTSFGSMFKECRSLTSIPTLNTSKGISFNGMFYGCRKLESIPMLNTSNGTDFGWMFRDCYSLTTIPKLDTSNGTHFSNMLSNCKTLTSVPSLNTSKGVYFDSMFSGCNALTSIPQLNTSNGTNFGWMFRECHSLTSVPLLDISKSMNFSFMFYGCSSLTSIPLLDTSKGTDFNNMFAGCISLESVPQLNTSKGVNFKCMFSVCRSLTIIPSIDTSNGVYFTSMFSYCSSLAKKPNLDLSKAKDISLMYYRTPFAN